jgi:spermidine synthase
LIVGGRLTAGDSVAMQAPAVLLIFFLSGMAGLIFQVVWVREFGLIFGNTIHSAALVTGVFLGGLGLGGTLAGIVADRAYRRDRLVALRLYALSEAIIGMLGLGVAWALPRLEALSAAVSSYRAGADGWFELTTASYLFRYLVAIALLAPVTLLMGGTLTLLIRFLVGDEVTRAGWRVGLLYGLNTAGAACGCLLVDILWIPALGIARTQLFAAGLNVTAAAGGLIILSRARRSTGGDQAPVRQVPRSDSSPVAPLVAVASAVALTGFAAMGTEILWFRFLTSALGQYRLVFSLLLAQILIGIWLGSLAGGYLSRRFGAAALWFMGAQIAVALSTLGSLWLFDMGPVQQVIHNRLEQLPEGIGLFGELAIQLGAILHVVALPAFFMGASYPLANAIVQDREGSVGTRAGLLYLANSIGSVAGSTATGFVLLPALGMKWSLLALLACGLSSLIPLAHTWRRGRPSPNRGRGPARALAAGLAATIVMLVGWSLTPPDELTLKSFRSVASAKVRDALRPPYLVAASEGPLESIVVLDVPGQGRALYTNGHPMSSTARGAQRYMRAFVHLPLLHLEAPENVLVICFGVGNTAHAASLHRSLRRIEVADISRHVLDQAPHFAATNGQVLRDPRVAVFVNDGRQHLRMMPPDRYDLITLEPPPINFSGVASLYSREFYALARSRLRSGGFLSQWLPVPQVPAASVRSMIRAFTEVFPGALLLHGDGGNFIMVGRRDRVIELDPATLERRLAANPEVSADLERIQMGGLTDIFATFAADAPCLESAVTQSVALTDDRPFIEYDRVYHPLTPIPHGVVDVGRIATWCPGCFGEGGPIAAVKDLTTYLGIMNGFYSWPRSGLWSGMERLPPSWSSAMDSAAVARTVEHDPYLRLITGGH